MANFEIKGGPRREVISLRQVCQEVIGFKVRAIETDIDAQFDEEKFWQIIQATFPKVFPSRYYWICNFEVAAFIDELKADPDMTAAIESLAPGTTLAEGIIGLIDGELTKVIKKYLFTKIRISPQDLDSAWADVEPLLEDLRTFFAGKILRPRVVTA